MWISLLTVTLRMLAWTWRVQRPPWPIAGPCVVAFWHGEQLPAVALHRDRGIWGVASLSTDGQVVADVLGRLGYGVIRGSTSKGALRVVRGALVVLANHGIPALAVDGPRGPRGSIHPGVQAIATRANVPVVYVKFQSRSLRLRTWDKFLVPHPFASVRIHYGVWRPGDPPLTEVMCGEFGVAA